MTTHDGTARLTGRITIHPRGFGFLNFEGPEGEWAAFVTPPDLNPFLDGDRVSATVTTAEGGRSTATSLALVERQRTELFGVVTTHGRRRFLRVNRVVANTDWPFAEASVAGAAEGLEDGASVVAGIRGGELVPLRTVPAGADLGLERCVVRHGIRSEFPSAAVEAARAAATAPLSGARRDLRDVPTVTIDAASTTDIDDALSVIPATRTVGCASWCPSRTSMRSCPPGRRPTTRRACAARASTSPAA